MVGQRSWSLRISLFVAIVCLVFVCPSFRGSASGGWVIEAVEDVQRNFQDLSPRAIAADRDGRPHIAYGSNRLYHAYFDGERWQIETVDSSPRVGSFAAIAVDRFNRIHISYYDLKNGDLKYATNASGVWDAVTLDSTGDVGRNGAIAVDGSGKVHIAYHDFTVNCLKYATNAGGSWAVGIIDNGPTYEGSSPAATAIAVDGAGRVHVGYEFLGDIKYAVKSGDGWVATILNSANWHRGYLSLALEASGKAHLSWMDFNDRNIYYASDGGGTWSITAVGSGSQIGGYPSMAIDGAGRAHFSYVFIDGSGGELRYVTNESGSWIPSTVGTTTGLFSSISLDSAGRVHIGYYEASSHRLGYATNRNGSWAMSTVDSAGSLGSYPAIGLDGSGNASIGYFDWANGDLKLAANATGSWVNTIVDGEGTVGWFSSMAFDSSGSAHMSYYDWSNWDNGILKYATNASGSWVTTTIDSSGNAGWDTSTAVDGSGKVHISYRDWNSGMIKYATNVSGSWIFATVAGPGLAPSLAVSPAGVAHISYFDHTTGNMNLKYATNKDGSWVTTVADSCPGSGDTSSLALDASGSVHIAYYDNPNADLKYATNAGGSWVTITVDSADRVGWFPAIALDSSGAAHISYYDEMNGHLKYATNAGGSWRTVTVDNAPEVGNDSSIALDASGRPHIAYSDNANATLKHATLSDITVTPTPPVYFGKGSINIGSASAPEIFTITNEGKSNMTIRSIGLSGGDTTMFSLKTGGPNPCPGLAPVLPAGTACTFEVSFSPLTAGPKSANLRIAFADPGNPPIDLLLTGNGMKEPVFDDVPEGSFAENFINSMAYQGVTAGCGTANYCPEDPISRAQMAVFIVTAMGQAPAESCTGRFKDVSARTVGDSFCRYIEKLEGLGITAGCGNGSFCPEDTVTREQIAVFVTTAFNLRSAERSASQYALPVAALTPLCTGEVFLDVNPETTGDAFCGYIEEFARRGFTDGCGEGNYCLDTAVTRAEIAVFLVTALTRD